MIISYVGNRNNLASDGKSYNTEAHIALTLEDMGHEVRFIQEDTIKPGQISSMVAGSDMFLWQRTWPDKITKQDLRDIESQGIPTVSFHLDAYAQIARDGGLGMKSAFWDTQYVFSPEGSVQAKKIFKELGINHFYSPAAVFKDEAYIASPVDHFKHDIVFVGGGRKYSHPEWNFYRVELMNFLENTYGKRFVKYGYPEKLVRGTELNQLYSSCKIVIGDTLCKDFTDSYYYSDRIFETTGRGGFIIHPYIPGITDHFKDREEAVFYAYRNWTQLKNLIDYYLEHDEERERIRVGGNARAVVSNTYHDRFKVIFDTLRSQGAIK